MRKRVTGLDAIAAMDAKIKALYEQLDGSDSVSRKIEEKLKRAFRERKNMKKALEPK